MTEINIIHEKILKNDGRVIVLEQTLVQRYEVNFDDYRCCIGNTLYEFLKDNKGSFSLAKGSILDYFRGYDTDTWRSLENDLEDIDDSDLIIITYHEWKGVQS